MGAPIPTWRSKRSRIECQIVLQRGKTATVKSKHTLEYDPSEPPASCKPVSAVGVEKLIAELAHFISNGVIWCMQRLRTSSCLLLCVKNVDREQKVERGM
jgi:hypothetical protein